MQKIYEFALSRVIVDTKVLCGLLDQLDGCQGERVIEALIGITDPKAIEIAIPKCGNYHNETNKSCCTLERFNYVQNTVTYSYIYREYRCLRTQEAADEFHKDGHYDWKGSTPGKIPTEEYQFVGFFDRKQTSTCDVPTWENEIRRNKELPLEKQYYLNIDAEE